MSGYPLFVFIIIVLVVVGAFAYVLVQKSADGELGVTSSFFKNYSNWLITPPGGFSTSSIEPENVPSISIGERVTSESGDGGGGGGIEIQAELPPQVPQPVPPQGFTVSQLSPQYQKVWITSVKPSYNAGDIATFVLQADGGLSGSLNITNWKFRSNKGEVFIPQGIAYFNTLSLPPQSDIMLNAGDYVNVYSTKSIVGVNFKINKCMGYLQDIVYRFDPAVWTSCPSLYDRNEITSFSGRCQSYIMSIGGCQVPDPAVVSSFTGDNDGSCRDVLNRIHYRTCYETHVYDSDFLSQEWRVWLDKPIPMDIEHDRILLFDRQGLLVHEYLY